MPRLLPLLALGTLATLSARAIAATPVDPWQTALTFDYNTAAERFAELHEQTPDDPRISVAYASALLVKQPRTESNIRAARDLFAKVAGGSSDQTPLALYLLARVELDHLDPAQPDSARAHLERLRRDHPGHALADQAAVELAYLSVYDSATQPDVAAIAVVETLLASVKTTGAARDLHLLLGSLKLRRLHDKAAALPHYVAARAAGFEQPLRNADVDLTVANLARETGDPALARRHYAAFLAAAPRDIRATTVRRLLAGLPSDR